MEEHQFKIVYFLIKFVLLLQLVYLVNQNQFGAEANQSELSDRMTKIETKNLQQESEIVLLKTVAVEDRKDINQLRQRVSRLEESSFANFTRETNHYRKKRPVRLLPQRLFYKERNETEEQMKRFYGPPTSCEELGKLGYTLNGFYLIKGIDESNSTRIKTVYCQFKQPPAPKNEMKLETAIGLVDIKSTIVQFFVERNIGDYGEPSKSIKITFHNPLLNVGNCFDWKNQWFSAPSPGTYFFSFSGTAGSKYNAIPTAIQVKINRNIRFYIMCPRNSPFAVFSYQFSMKLNFDDKVDLFVVNGEIYSLSFTGWMLDENLDII